MCAVKQKDIFFAIQRVNRALKRRSAIVNTNGYGRSLGLAMHMIASHNGINARDLAKLLEIQPPSLTVKLKKLEADGNIICKRDTHDARFISIYMTPKGYETLENNRASRKEGNVNFCDCLTDEEKAQFCDMCDRLSKNLKLLLDEKVQQNFNDRMAKITSDSIEADEL